MNWDMSHLSVDERRPYVMFVTEVLGYPFTPSSRLYWYLTCDAWYLKSVDKTIYSNWITTMITPPPTLSGSDPFKQTVGGI